MNTANWIGVILGLSMVNGILSPYLLVLFVFAPLWLPEWLPGEGTALYLASLLLSTITVLVAGVPAALTERAFPALRGTPAILAVWAAGALALSVPALTRLVTVLLGG